MAYIGKRKIEKGTVYDVQFYIGTKKHKIGGFKSKREAVKMGEMVDVLVRSMGGVIPSHVEKWLEKLDDRNYKKLEEKGLAPCRIKPGTIKELSETFLNDPSVKPNTIKNRESRFKYLFNFFGAETPVASITPEQALKFSYDLKEKVAQGTWGRAIKDVKMFFNRAVDLGWIKTNPFGKLKGSNTTNKARRYLVTQEVTQKILGACKSPKLRLVFSLARFGALRIPSEIKFMEWGDIDFIGNRLIVRVPKKTNKADQKAGVFVTRPVPLFPELRKAFTEYQESLKGKKSKMVFPNCETGQAFTKQLIKILEKVGVKRWPKFFVNMRSTRDTELRRLNYPEQDVNLWVGHTKAVALDYYLQTSNELFSEAAKGEPLHGEIIPKQQEKTTPKNGVESGVLIPKMGENGVLNYDTLNGFMVILEPLIRALNTQNDTKLNSFTPEKTRPAGVEPTTYGLEVRCSIQLSHGRGSGDPPDDGSPEYVI